MHPSIHARQSPDKVAYRMVGGGQAVSYAELEAGSNRLAHFFRQSGLRVGDRIALMLENHPRYFEICWAAQRAGIVYTAISSRLTGPPQASWTASVASAATTVSARA